MTNPRQRRWLTAVGESWSHIDPLGNPPGNVWDTVTDTNALEGCQ